jgi:6-phosphogluconolactonase
MAHPILLEIQVIKNIGISRLNRAEKKYKVFIDCEVHQLSKELRIYSEPDSLSHQAASYIFEKIVACLHENEGANIVLSGGNTPKSCYTYLSHMLKNRIKNFNKINWFVGDERWVPESDPSSNISTIRTTLFGSSFDPDERLYSWRPGIDSPFKAAIRYSSIIRSIFGARPKSGPDILLLGLGEDGHTASLFPGSQVPAQDGELSPLARNTGGFALAVHVKDKNIWRLSLSPLFLNSSKLVIFLVTGSAKKESFLKLISGDPAIPASWIDGKETVFFVTSDTVEESFVKGIDEWPVVMEV